MLAVSISVSEIAVIEDGTSWRFCSLFSAVTTISSIPELSSCDTAYKGIKDYDKMNEVLSKYLYIFPPRN